MSKLSFDDFEFVGTWVAGTATTWTGTSADAPVGAVIGTFSSTTWGQEVEREADCE